MTGARFGPDEEVQVKALFPPGHVRTPYFARGKRGRVVEMVGLFGDPSCLAYGDKTEHPVALYRVRFDQVALWPDYAGQEGDSLMVDVYETWLEPAREAPNERS